MKVYVVEEYLNDYLENGGGLQGVAAVFDSQEKAEEYCKPPCPEGDEAADDEEIYYEWYEYEVK